MSPTLQTSGTRTHADAKRAANMLEEEEGEEEEKKTPVAVGLGKGAKMFTMTYLHDT